MIPRPPFASALTLEQELAEFEVLKPRLAEVWDSISLRDEEPHTSVVVPSLTLDQAEMRKLEGVSFYEERLLFLLIRLRNPRARVVFVTSQPVHPLVLEHTLVEVTELPPRGRRDYLSYSQAVFTPVQSSNLPERQRPTCIQSASRWQTFRSTVCSTGCGRAANTAAAERAYHLGGHPAALGECGEPVRPGDSLLISIGLG